MKAISKRLARDFENLAKEGPALGIFIKARSNDDLSVLRMMLVGPKGPYENCLFFFDIDFPNPYPINSPHVVFQCPYTIRCHPNLYMEGKVCLSILGTWTGPPWTPMMTLNTIAQTILMILDDAPLRNEPAYEKASLEKVQPYTDYVRYVCLRESTNLYRQCLTETLPPGFRDFHNEIMQTLIVNRERLNVQIAEINATVAPVRAVGYGNRSYSGEKMFIEPL